MGLFASQGKKSRRDPRTKRRRVRKETRPGESGTRSGPKIRQVDFQTLIFKNISIEHFDAGKEQLIRSELLGLFTLRCSQAFEAAGLRSPTIMTGDHGLAIRPSDDLFKYSASQLGLVSEHTRQAYKWEFSTGRAQEGSITPFLGYTTDGRGQIYLHDNAFKGESYFPNPRFSLRDVLSHAFIHQAGVITRYGKLGYLRHDLAGLSDHDVILEACR